MEDPESRFHQFCIISDRGSVLRNPSHIAVSSGRHKEKFLQDTEQKGNGRSIAVQNTCTEDRDEQVSREQDRDHHHSIDQ